MKATIEKITFSPSKIVTTENLNTCSKETQKAYAYFYQNKNTIFAPNKYLPSQKNLVLKKVNKIYQEQSATPLKKVIISILSDLPDFLPGDNLLLVTGDIVEEWDKLQKQKLPTK